MAETFTGDPREGITTKTTKAEMMERLNKLADMFESQQKKDRNKLAKMQKDLRKKWAGRATQSSLLSVVLSGTDEEWKETLEFLEDAQELVPEPLRRLLIGLRIGWNGQEEDDVV